MTELRFEDYEMPAASLGEESALPDIHVNAYIRAPIAVSERVTGEDARDIGRGMITTLLPYAIQDGYGREASPRAFRAAVLENECLRAVFLPELGGRLWSLYDKREGRELLYKNDVFRPANLALRNAWFSGGVEWNVGIKGHNPLTASPLFAAEGENAAGEPVLRMYEYESIRGVTYSVEATLCAEALLVGITVENTADTDTPMYWWSNIAVPETPGCRVLAPATETYFCAYTDGGYLLDKTGMPTVEGRDISYPEHSPRSRDFFFRIPNDETKWVAAVDAEGRGLLHLSDPLLRGRKLFVWGNHPGGRHWNEWLTEGAGPYVEIQAGLARTQLEHFPMPAHTTLSWQECYTALSLSPETAHGDYFAAVGAVAAIARDRLSLLDRAATEPSREPRLRMLGSGRGALEERIRGRRVSARCAFPEESLTAAEDEWLALLAGRQLPPRDPSIPPTSFVVGKGWRALLEAEERRDWYLEYQLGLLRYTEGEIEGARAAFLASAAATPNAWALRALAMLEKQIDGDPAAAARHLLAARALMPGYRPLLVECGETLLSAGSPDTWITLYEGLSPTLAAGRLTMLYGAALARAGRYREAAAVLDSSLSVPDIKEGEYALSAIWIEIRRGILAEERGVAPESLTEDEVLAAYPLPYALDFRMH